MLNQDEPQFTTVKEILSFISQSNDTPTQVSQHQETETYNYGFRALDEKAGNLKKQEITSIVVKPGNGKTALLLSLVNNLALKQSLKVALFSPERSSTKVVQRLIESQVGISAKKVLQGDVQEKDKERVDVFLKSLSSSDILIDDSQTLTDEDFVQKCTYLKEQCGINIILIDRIELYDRYINDDVVSEENLANTMQKLKQLAVDLNIPIVIFSQMANAYTINKGIRPDISNVSNYVADNSDNIMVVYRPDMTETGGKSILEVILVKKQSQSTNEVVNLLFIDSLDQVADL